MAKAGPGPRDDRGEKGLMIWDAGGAFQRERDAWVVILGLLGAKGG